MFTRIFPVGTPTHCGTKGGGGKLHAAATHRQCCSNRGLGQGWRLCLRPCSGPSGPLQCVGHSHVPTASQLNRFVPTATSPHGTPSALTYEHTSLLCPKYRLDSSQLGNTLLLVQSTNTRQGKARVGETHVAVTIEGSDRLGPRSSDSHTTSDFAGKQKMLTIYDNTTTDDGRVAAVSGHGPTAHGMIPLCQCQCQCRWPGQAPRHD
jgi:hypothetical protein